VRVREGRESYRGYVDGSDNTFFICCARPKSSLSSNAFPHALQHSFSISIHNIKYVISALRNCWQNNAKRQTSPTKDNSQSLLERTQCNLQGEISFRA
jgi:hypothetical protein